VAEAKTWYLHPIESAPACGSNRIVWPLVSFTHTIRQEFPAGDRWGSHHKLNACNLFRRYRLWFFYRN
jgi:hypothetical protein